jgi:hypothetical protein
MTAQILQKLEQLSVSTPDGRQWTKDNMRSFNRWFIRYLKRNARVRDDIIGGSKSLNNTRQVLEVFSTEFCRSVPFRLV